LDELPADEAMANLYAQGNRWVVVFSDATGPRGDRTFIHIDSFERWRDDGEPAQRG